ncbi:hypothetical protein MHPYR_60162 [uncultured Mycobacterium sp.]|uniref:Uncharacterized protein n=1 Tax=uncultured Mycobacterium sp. TaxID=171292 RepID=A0A1Y5PJ26_9MYCO|nr:hypothetical protein MHPYR_60162 [uncultured Mycobacterium sp.]
MRKGPAGALALCEALVRGMTFRHLLSSPASDGHDGADDAAGQRTHSDGPPRSWTCTGDVLVIGLQRTITEVAKRGSPLRGIRTVSVRVRLGAPGASLSLSWN